MKKTNRLLLIFLLILSSCTKGEIKKEIIVKSPDELLFEALDNDDIFLVKEALRLGADVNAKDPSDDPIFNHGETALVLTYGLTDFDLSRYLIEQGADIDARDIHGNTVLMHASLFGNIEQVKYLISKGADVHAVTNDGITSLIKASLIDFIPMNSGSQERVGTEVISYLISKGSEVNTKTEYGETSLMFAARLGNLDTVKCLISNGANINDKDNEGNTPLMYAAGSDMYNGLSESEIDMALKIGNSMAKSHNLNDSNGLMLEFRTQIESLGDRNLGGMIELLGVVNYLATMGAEVNDKNNNGETALMQATINGNTAIVKSLIMSGAQTYLLPPNIAEEYLFTGCEIGKIELVEQALKSDVDLNLKRNLYGYYGNERTPLEMAVNYGYLNIINSLIENGADQLNESLLIATGKGHLEVVKLLISKGADKDYCNNYKETPMKEASRSGYPDIVKYLESLE